MTDSDYELPTEVIRLITDERLRQLTKWGDQRHSPTIWLPILGEEFGELCQAILHEMWERDDAVPFDELVQVVAVGVAWIEDHLRKRDEAERNQRQLKEQLEQMEQLEIGAQKDSP